jgi:HSP20 family protein
MNRIVQYQSPLPGRLLAGRSPWAGLENEIDRMFESAFSGYASPATPRFPVDVFEDTDNTYVRAELPGVTRDDINVEMADGYLNINASRKDGEESFALTRSVGIPEAVEADRVSASYENGVLTVTLPKPEQAKPRKISVAVK